MSYYNIGIIENFDKEFDYSYSNLDLEYKDIIKKYNCISVDKDLFDEVINNVENIDTYFQSYGNKGKYIDPYGVTLIPPKSLLQLIDVVISLGNNSNDTKSLIELINKAHKENKLIICFGI